MHTEIAKVLCFAKRPEVERLSCKPAELERTFQQGDKLSHTWISAQGHDEAFS